MNNKNQTDFLMSVWFFVHKMVRDKGLEPLRTKTLDPKSSASANSANPALISGDSPGTWTPDPLVKSQLLYRLS